MDQYANVRPTRILPGVDAPLKRCRHQDLNWVIVRENTSMGNMGGFVGPLLVGWLKDKRGNYAGGLYAVRGMMALSAVVIVALNRQTLRRAPIPEPEENS